MQPLKEARGPSAAKLANIANIAGPWKEEEKEVESESDEKIPHD